ncbi:phosphotransferase [Corallococcus sp. bb12-1]|uniref:phosphotransferase n=1 Tax=Corallococcus sp. bb12-1 TaxID=2996784 RepID=UPI00226FD4B8|nr:phosphotransferase [Corallococcus sp. bb12-1]MCY1041126.1 phosphotransferase [Corallococcus sp. bb12-1]
MSRFGVEPKPPWRQLPEGVRQSAEGLLGTRVAHAARVYGGYSPSATYRLRLDDGQRVFFKGMGGAMADDYMTRSIHAEEQTYRRLDPFITPWAPHFLGAFTSDGWHVLLMEDLGRSTVPPWSPAKLRAAARSFAAFHQHNIRRRLPRWLPEQGWRKFATPWEQLATGPGGLHAPAVLAGRQAARARRWLSECVPVLGASAARLARPVRHRTLLHLDTRSDNVRLTGDQLRIFDWNLASAGPAEFDAAMLAGSIAAEPGPAPERFIQAYAQVLPLDAPLLAACVSGLAGYFCASAWRPPMPHLPRLREGQKRHLKAFVAWAARLHNLPEPGWLDALRIDPPAPLPARPSRKAARLPGAGGL